MAGLVAEGHEDHGENILFHELGEHCGWVSSYKDVENFIQNYSIKHDVSFVAGKKEKAFNTNAEPNGNSRIYFEDKNGIIPFDGVPFLYVATQTRDCLFGRQKHKAKMGREKARRETELLDDHPRPSKTRRSLQPSKKKGCKASVIVKEVVRFPNFMAKKNTERIRKTVSSNLRACEITSQPFQRRFYISFPDSHNGHPVSQPNFLLGVKIRTEQCIDLELIKIYSGIWKWIGLKDQDNLLHLVAKWREQNKDDRFACTPASHSRNQHLEQDQDETDDDVFSSIPVSTSFFFCHQSKYQRHLLQRYGNEICLLDATYKTTKYALPLFFLAVKTNFGYSVAGEFVVESETREAIKQGLAQIKLWMDQEGLQWKPKHFMTDFCEREIHAIEELFPNTCVYLCDFHREQSWSRWLTRKENGLSNKKETVLTMLRRCADSVSLGEFEQALNRLQTSPEWLTNTNLQRWISKTWLPERKRWVWAFRSDGHIVVNTNNGIERQNKAFKYNYLEQRRNLTLSAMITALIEEYLPSMMLSYVKSNVTASDSLGGDYVDCLPPYLKNRPPTFITHCMAKSDLGDLIYPQEIQVTAEGFMVQSQTDDNKVYKVTIEGELLPECECHSWKISHLPCKHMFAVITTQATTSWYKFPESYRNSPFFTLDDEVTQFVCKDDSSGFTGETQVPSIQIDSSEVDTLPSRKTGSQSMAALCREKCELIKSSTFLCSDKVVLTSLCEKLMAVNAFIESNLKHDNDLVSDIHIEKNRKRTLKLDKDKNAKRKKTIDITADATTESTKPTKPVTLKVAKDKKARRKKVIDITTDATTESTKPTKPVTLKVATDKKARRKKVIDITTDATTEITKPVVQTSGLKEKILEKVELWKKTLSKTKWTDMIKQAIVTRNMVLDEVSQIAVAAIDHTDDEEATDISLAIMNMLPPSLMDGARFRLMNLILYNLVIDGHITTSYDVLKAREEYNQGIRDLNDATSALSEPYTEPYTENHMNSSPVKDNKPVHREKVLKSAIKTGGCSRAAKKLRFASSLKSESKQVKGAVQYPFGGLPNPAGLNLCFGNATLQCLNTTDIQKIIHCHEFCDLTCFICQLRAFFEGYPSLSALGVCQKMQDFWPTYKIGSQQDGHEMLQLLLDQLQRFSGGSSVYKRTFEGEIESTVSCGECGMSRSNTEVYNSLSLSVKNCISLKQSLSNFFNGEEISGYICGSCHKNGTATKQNTISAIPRNLIVHLKRFEMLKDKRRKDERHLDIDEYLNVKIHVKPALKNNLEYKGSLTGALVHYGTLTKGHYFCYVRSGLQWFKIDDTKVTKIKLTEQRLGEAYILFYQMLPRPYTD